MSDDVAAPSMGPPGRPDAVVEPPSHLEGGQVLLYDGIDGDAEGVGFRLVNL
jgi:hypothetical protein